MKNCVFIRVAYKNLSILFYVMTNHYQKIKRNELKQQQKKNCTKLLPYFSVHLFDFGHLWLPRHFVRFCSLYIMFRRSFIQQLNNFGNGSSIFHSKYESHFLKCAIYVVQCVRLPIFYCKHYRGRRKRTREKAPTTYTT